jgi:hypothetical protein
MPTVDSDDPRLQVTPALREACADYGSPDAETETALLAAELDRLSGLTWEEQRMAIGVMCWDDACLTCMTAVVNQVYGVQ